MVKIDSITSIKQSRDNLLSDFSLATLIATAVYNLLTLKLAGPIQFGLTFFTFFKNASVFKKWSPLVLYI